MDDLVVLISTVFLVLAIILVKIIMDEDSQVESVFFTIDTSRTLGFTFSYMILLDLLIPGMIFYVPIGLVLLISFLGILILIIGNIIALIITGISLIFGGSLFFIPIEPLLQFLDIIIEFTFDLVFDTPIFYLYFPIFLIISPVITGWQIGKYVESFKSGLFSAVIWQLILFSFGLVIIQSGTNLSEIMGPYVNLTFLIFLHGFILIIPMRISNTRKNAKNEIIVIDIQKYIKIIIFIFGGFLYLLLIGFWVLVTKEGLQIDITNISLYFSAMFGLSLIYISLRIIRNFIHGDWPLEIKLDEIEIREDLLEKAKEFRELDRSNIDDFIRKSSTKMI